MKTMNMHGEKIKDYSKFLGIFHTICIQPNHYDQIVLSYLIIYFSSGVNVRIVLDSAFNI